MGPEGTHNYKTGDQSLNDMVASLAKEAIAQGSTTLLDDELGSFGVPNPRILIVGCGGSGNNTLNRITHLGVEGAVTVAINTDSNILITLEHCRNYSLEDTSLEDLVQVETQAWVEGVLKPVEK